MDWRDPATVPMPLGEPGNVELKSLRVAFYALHIVRDAFHGGWNYTFKPQVLAFAGHVISV